LARAHHDLHDIIARISCERRWVGLPAGDQLPLRRIPPRGPWEAWIRQSSLALDGDTKRVLRCQGRCAPVSDDQWLIRGSRPCCIHVAPICTPHGVRGSSFRVLAAQEFMALRRLAGQVHLGGQLKWRLRSLISTRPRSPARHF
jgi:hypothetical protein